MRILVQKYGGTSVASTACRQQVVTRVAAAVRDGWAVAVVVSAMGRSGSPYATDTLVALAHDGGGLPDARELDLLMGCGETVSAVVLAAALRTAGLDPVVLTGGQAGLVTNNLFGHASILEWRPERPMNYLKQGKVLVVTGFQGADRDGELTTLGRGGSDISAVALGAALHAELVEIYTDVDGVKTADPRLVPAARTIPRMTYDETSQMAHEGAKVLHPRAVEIAARFKLPVRVRSTFDDLPGTLVTADDANGDGDPWAALVRPGPVTGVTHTDNIAHVSFGSADGDDPPYTRTFQVLAGLGVNVDMISVTPQACSFVIGDPAGQQSEQALRRAGIRPTIRTDLAKISVVGQGMRHTPGVMARISQALLQAGVDILQTSDSLTTISCLVQRVDLERAARALHTAFGLDRPEEE